MTVLDASAAVELLLGRERSEALGRRLLADGESLHAPALLDVEVVQVVRRFVRTGEVSPVRGGQAIADLADLRVHRHRHEPLLDKIWKLRDNVTAYDAAYLALAEALRAPLVTCDGKLAGVPRLRAKVEVF